MNKRVWLFGSLTALVACLAAAEACVLDRGGTCEEPGGCVRGAVGNAGPGGGGLGGGQAARCEGHADCEDWNPCTIDTCDAAGVCRTADVGTGEVVGGTSCTPLVCDGGGPVEQAQPAGTPCDGGGVCDGAGACQPPLALGGGCDVDAQCESGFCVEGACCMYACDGECAMCNPVTFDDCAFHSTGEHDPECGDNTECVGGQCKPAN